jgi:hypothetical protein
MKNKLSEEQLILAMIKLQTQIKELQYEIKNLKSFVLINTKELN